MRTLRTILVVLGILLPTMALAGLERQAIILGRVFSYDYNLKTRAGESVVLAVVYKTGDAASEAIADAWMLGFHPLQGIKIQGLTFTAVKLAYEGVPALKIAIAKQGIDILLVCEKLDAELGAIKDFSRSQKILTVGSKEEYVQQGLSVGVFAKGDQTSIEVNLPATTLEGASFSSEVLSLARVIKK